MLPHRSRTAVLVFLLPALALFVLSVLLPIVQSIGLSLFDWDGITDPTFVGLDNYARLFTQDDVFWPIVGNGLVYLGINLLFQVGVALALANLLTYITRGREVVKTLILLPAVISTVAIALLFRRFYSAEPEGLVNQLLGAVGLSDLATAWLSNVHTVLVSVSVPDGWRSVGLYTLILYAALISVPAETEEAAKLDGAGWWRVFTNVRVPHIRPVLVTTAVMAATYSLRGFDVPYLLTNGGPGQASEIPTTYMYKSAFTSADFGYASTISVFIVLEAIIAVVIIIGLFQRREKDGVA